MAANIWRNDPHAGFRNAVVARIQILKLVRRLRGVMHRQRAALGIVVRDDGPRLERYRRMTAEAEVLLDHDCAIAR
jgi:hypothetical protein